jgi:D-alanyl-D-alanine carboxypeptidase (penicillin-binding protein 5/6)
MIFIPKHLYSQCFYDKLCSLIEHSFEGHKPMLRKNTLLTLSIITTLSLSGIINNHAFANDVIPISTQPQQQLITPSAPNLDAKAYILIDAASGKILADKASDIKMAPASLTKLMSLYIISGALKNGSIHLDDKVRISKKAWQTDGSRMFVKVGDEVPVSDLLKGIIVASGNDATVAMAEFVAGTEDAFTNIMNAQAKALGMNNSNFLDSTGLPNPNHYSTARDLAILARALQKNFPDIYALFSEKWFSYQGIKQPNRNRLLWRYQYADGLKTGHTNEAGYCLVSSANKDGMRLISVIMGAPNDEARTEDSMRLLTFGFRFYETHKLYNAGTTLTNARIWKGVNKETALGITKDLYVTSPSGQYKNIKIQLVLDSPMKAPIKKGSTYGKINIVLNNQVLSSEPLIALNDNQVGGIWRRFTDSINFSYNKWFSRRQEKANTG